MSAMAMMQMMASTATSPISGPIPASTDTAATVIARLMADMATAMTSVAGMAEALRTWEDTQDTADIERQLSAAPAQLGASRKRTSVPHV
jgi:hypothetical protein